jgi:hypothetical protein
MAKKGQKKGIRSGFYSPLCYLNSTKTNLSYIDESCRSLFCVLRLRSSQFIVPHFDHALIYIEIYTTE